MIPASPSDEQRDLCIREYQADFDITLEDVTGMSSLLGMEIDHNKGNLTICLDIYIQETLA